MNPKWMTLSLTILRARAISTSSWVRRASKAKLTSLEMVSHNDDQLTGIEQYVI